MRTGRPLVTLKAALTLDGKIAAPGRQSRLDHERIARAHVQQLRHDTDAILTGIGTVLADDCLLTDRTGLPRSRPLLRIVIDSLLRTPPHCRMIDSCRDDVVVVTTSAAPAERRKAIEARGARVLSFDGPGGRTDLRSVVDWLAREKYLSLMIEAGSRVNWAALEAEIVDKIFFYYGAKILGGLQSLPMAGGAGRRQARRTPLACAIWFCTTSPRTNSPWRAMFTGIIEELGTVARLESRGDGARLTVECASVVEGAREGSSIAVNGVCLTAVDLRPGSFSADLAPETMRRSNLGRLRAGSSVNLERPLLMSDRLSGHIVQGHVDGVGEVVALEELGDDNWWLRVRVPAELDRYLVYKGSDRDRRNQPDGGRSARKRHRRNGDPAHLPQHDDWSEEARRGSQSGMRRAREACGEAAREPGREARFGGTIEGAGVRPGEMGLLDHQARQRTMLEITWLGHGTFQLRLSTGEVLLLDPWTEGNPAYPAGHKIERVDAILISHGHFDHIHDAVPLAKKFAPQVVAIYETAHWLESNGVEKVTPMNKGGSQKVGPITVTMTHAVHSCGILDDGKIIYGGEAAGLRAAS